VKIIVVLEKKLKILVILFLFISISGYSQWVCRSKLGAHLKPFKKDFPLLWAAEITLGHGYMTDERQITNAMMFATLDYSWKKHQIYVEGGTKAWRNTYKGPGQYDVESHGPGGFFQKQRFGIRDVFYRYKKEDNSIVVGFQQFTLGDYFLVNERALGLSYKNTFGSWDINVNGGSVLKDFSRFGTFCSINYLYNTIRDRVYPVLGENIGETNFAAIVATWTPKEKETEGGDDEFGEFSEFGDEPKNKIFKNASLIGYTEFGTLIPEMRYHFGVNSLFEFPFKIKLKTEVLNQTIINNNALIYYVNLSRTFNFGSKGQSFINLKYYGKYNIDENAMAYASFSNLFIGEVMRMDMMDMPLYQFAFKHRVPKWKSQIKIQLTQQFDYQHISEFNVAIGKTFFHHAKLTIMGSRMIADDLDGELYMVRAEMRVTF